MNEQVLKEITKNSLNRQTLTKKSLIQAVSMELGCTVVKAKDLVNTIINEILHALSQGEDVKFVNFGRFRVHQTSETTLLHPVTAQITHVPKMMRARFTASTNLKAKLNPKNDNLIDYMF